MADEAQFSSRLMSPSPPAAKRACYLVVEAPVPRTRPRGCPTVLCVCLTQAEAEFRAAIHAAEKELRFEADYGVAWSPPVRVVAYRVTANAAHSLPVAFDTSRTLRLWVDAFKHRFSCRRTFLGHVPGPDGFLGLRPLDFSRMPRPPPVFVPAILSTEDVFLGHFGFYFLSAFDNVDDALHEGLVELDEVLECHANVPTAPGQYRLHCVVYKLEPGLPPIIAVEHVLPFVVEDTTEDTDSNCEDEESTSEDASEEDASEAESDSSQTLA